MSSVRAGDDPLVVPIDVVALCVGTDDYQQATSAFAGATAVYSEAVQSAHAAFLGQNATRGFDDPPWDQLEVGAHLHWALPDGLTRGGGKGAELDFPAVPNRWLVQRQHLVDGAVTTRSWLVESDALSAQSGSGTYTTLLVDPAQFQDGYAYLGATHEVTERGWSEARPGGPTLRAAAGTTLNAVTNGEVSFAAYYPSCRGVLGFWDALDDITGTTAQDPAQLTYTVVGWYADEQQDPVQAGATVAALQDARGWTLDAATAEPVGSLYSGTVQGIGWSPQVRYVHDQPVQAPLQAAAAIGNTASEALAAHFADVEPSAPPLFESVLDGFQSGLVETFKQPTPGALSAMQERLHDQRFAGQWSGTVYSVVPAEGVQGPVDLPVVLGDAVDTLNELTQRFEQCAFHADWFRWQLFTDWYRIFLIDPADRNTAYALAQQRYGAWQALDDRRNELRAQAHAQHVAVQAALGPRLQLRTAPAERFVQPSDPAVLITGPDVAFPQRYGGDGRYDDDGYLVCRLAPDVVTAVTVGGTELTAAALSAVAAPSGVPHGDTVTALLREACLLNPTLLAQLGGTATSTLETTLDEALLGETQTTWKIAGTPPSPVGVSAWTPGLWLPIYGAWTVEWLPLAPTTADHQPSPYPTNVVTANFTLDQDAGGTLAYEPGSGGIEVDPATADFPQQYLGAGHLTATPAAVLTRLLDRYLDDHTDATLRDVARQLHSGDGFLVVPLNGLSDALTQKTQGLQIDVSVPAGSAYAALTDAIAEVVGDAPRQGGPDFAGGFNPLRAGWLKLSLSLVDAFGQQRAVDIPRLVCAQSMTTTVQGSTVPSVAYLEPRISQPSRLAFHWLSADGSGAEELGGTPAVSPVCGWLLPNHLDGSLAIYDGQGRALGVLFPRQAAAGRSPVGFQSAPGDDATIDADLATVMRDQNPQLAAFATAIGGPTATAEFYRAMWRAIDSAADTIDPGSAQTDAQLAVLVGRPVALVQAAVRVELRGGAMLDLGWDATGEDTDAGLTDVELPVVLGDLADLSDGLVGFFTTPTPGGAYDLSTFYSEAAPAAASSGVVRPGPDTVTLTPGPPLDPDGATDPDLTSVTRHLLMVVDPRAAVHATTGVLPTASLSLPTEDSQAITSTLDLALSTAPVLRGAGGLTLPTPNESGYALAFVDQDRSAEGALEWIVDGDLTAPPSGGGAWAFTPQEIREGWLRFNPINLGFALTNAEGRPLVQGGATNALTLTVTNRATRTITLRRGVPVAEGVAPSGSVLYVHFGTLVAQADVSAITFAASGAGVERVPPGGRGAASPGAAVAWRFTPFTSPQYGIYWAAAPTADVTLAPGAQLTFAVTGLRAASGPPQAQVTFDYTAIDGLGDGVFADVLNVAPPASLASPTSAAGAPARDAHQESQP